MKHGFRVADSDMHVLEPPDLWQRWIDPAWRHAAPVGLTELRRDMRVKVKSHVVLRIGRVRAASPGAAWSAEQDRVYARAEERGWDPTSQREAMEAEGLDVAVLFPSRGLFVLGLDAPEAMGVDGLEPDFAAAIARAYNDWLADFCKAAPDRFFGAAMVAPHDVASAAKEARRAVETLGMKAVFLAPGCVNRRPWHDPYYDPLWAECERLGVPITFHGGGQTFLRPDFSLEVLDKLAMWHTMNQPLGVMTVAVSLCAGGVLERFPRLRVGLLEGNCAWAPWLFHRLDEHWEWVGRYEVPDCRRKPSEYFRASCFLAVEADEAPVRQYVEWFGDDNLVFSTDYPHADSKYPHAVEAFLRLPLGERSQRKILWDNWGRLYPIRLPDRAA
ncbi:MAG TPA: amidohydrolase family protein [Candidatus Binatia bacterium]|jgi:predicted TIM-barrel fold metal-dependent hydrolase|nr:amidohydrolase family protein [Candidatus Binatia bacterium]